ncbi:MAG: hypothetical protein MJZ26_08565 [Fibrobacter sp.]|nr:hypothetical protein [Fibrobacter sp.]
MKHYARFATLLSVASLMLVLAACGDDSSSTSANNDSETKSSSSSVIEPESSDSVDEPSSSQSEPQETQLSSSSEAESALVVPEGGLFRWVGSEGARVITGLDTDVATATEKLVSVKFMIQGEDKDTGSFNIMSIGSYVEM